MPALQEKMDNNQAERQALMDKYALIFEDAFPFFAMRKQFSKDSLAILLSKASSEIQVLQYIQKMAEPLDLHFLTRPHQHQATTFR